MLSQNVPKYHHYVNKWQIWTIGDHKIATTLILYREQYHLLKIKRKSGGCDHIGERPGGSNTKILTKISRNIKVIPINCKFGQYDNKTSPQKHI